MSDCVSHGAMWLESRVRVFAPRRPFAMAEEMPAVAMADEMPAVAPPVAVAAENAEKEKKNKQGRQGAKRPQSRLQRRGRTRRPWPSQRR